MASWSVMGPYTCRLSEGVEYSCRLCRVASSRLASASEPAVRCELQTRARKSELTDDATGRTHKHAGSQGLRGDKAQWSERKGGEGKRRG
uniref:Uncharacterized protein n=1 Tax=Knipowitschia caucasica TaxID=637954 RepID=A0AAV2LDR8_KNICA